MTVIDIDDKKVANPSTNDKVALTFEHSQNECIRYRNATISLFSLLLAIVFFAWTKCAIGILQMVPLAPISTGHLNWQ